MNLSAVVFYLALEVVVTNHCAKERLKPMINKRLIGLVKNSKKYIALNVISQWISLCANITLMGMFAYFLEQVYLGNLTHNVFVSIVVVTIVSLIIRFICTLISSKMSYLSSKSVKKTLRCLIYQKLLRLGPSYREKIKTSEVTQVSVEGVEQLETYFGAYLPQFFYALISPLTLFCVLSFISFSSALILLLCVPLIPITIIVVQKWAKKLLSKYWVEYATLGDTFLENIQGLTTTKIYQADEYKHKEMNAQSERFRKITMKVLSMQLNSITIMDLIAYGGAALGIMMAIIELNQGRVDLFGCVMIILLSADFFLPMRLLGSFFHIAMNGMAASEKIFRLLDQKEDEDKQCYIAKDCGLEISDLSYSYDQKRNVLERVNVSIPEGSFVALVGESGSGKSTIASILMERNKDYKGSIKIGGEELSSINERSLMSNITYISNQSYIFKGSVRDNLCIAKSDATDSDMWAALESVNLASFLRSEDGLDTQLEEKGSNLSGGQCQRLALARALLHDSRIYIFDEATSNIDVESENAIMKRIHELAKTKTVILISHRLLNVVNADNIYVLENGHLVESGNHKSLIKNNGVYRRLWDAQQELEGFVGEAV